ncbi:glycoside hydrolase family 9 protein [Spongiimicrobium salis]|uniref:glycoside hydrolase family 9 protein n=1 Tax=Spongiimicrobium salis TaxID=1667022 RepID=UPI00374CF58B
MRKNQTFDLGWICIVLILLCGCKHTSTISDKEAKSKIRLNQIGYYPNALKKAVVVVQDDSFNNFQLINTQTQKVVLDTLLSSIKSWDLAGEKVQIADFSAVAATGEYQVFVPGLGYSYPFEIKSHVYEEAFKGSIKGLYYQRAGMALEKKYAGKWHRAMGHPDDSIGFHPSSGKTTGVLQATKGWYDAGDYNKYVVNGSFPLGQLFLLQQEYPNSIGDGDLNIPESGNSRSDYLDELKYEMDWLLSMQDEDGGLFHKLTTLQFEKMLMPHKAVQKRFIVGKGTAASLDFAAVAAQAYRIFKSRNEAYAAQCLMAAEKAYEWAVDNPEIVYRNPDDVGTGEYGDTDFMDEWYWANAELYVSTQNPTYLEELQKREVSYRFKAGGNWKTFMRFLGIFDLLDHKEIISTAMYADLKEGVLGVADSLTIKARQMPYFQSINDFRWGSNSDVLSAATILVSAYRLDPQPKYLQAAQQAVDYIFGTNALGYSFLTGFGDLSPMNIHHRQSTADRILEPVPGLLSGGPNSRLQDTIDGAVYPKNVAPMQSWVDQEASYASNEICLNWNAPLTYVLGVLEAEAQ